MRLNLCQIVKTTASFIGNSATPLLDTVGEAMSPLLSCACSLELERLFFVIGSLRFSFLQCHPFWMFLRGWSYLVVTFQAGSHHTIIFNVVVHVSHSRSSAPYLHAWRWLAWRDKASMPLLLTVVVAGYTAGVPMKRLGSQYLEQSFRKCVPTAPRWLPAEQTSAMRKKRIRRLALALPATRPAAPRGLASFRNALISRLFW